MVKVKRNYTNQTGQFKLENAIYFCLYAKGRLRILPINALDEDFFTADGANLKPDKHKYGWKEVWVYPEHNRYAKF